MACFFAYADDSNPEKESSDSQPALESPAEPQETVTDTPAPPDKKAAKEEPAQPTDFNLNNPSTGTTIPNDAFGGGGGLGSRGFVSRPPQNYLMSSNGALTWNKDKTVFWGYRNSLGKWTAVRPPKDSGPAHPLVNKNVIALQLKDRVYGFSASVGQWQELLADKPVPVIQEDQVLVVDGDKLNIFSDKTGRWASPGEDVHDPQPVLNLLVDPSGSGQTFLQTVPGKISSPPAFTNKAPPADMNLSGISLGAGLTLNILARSNSAPNLWRRRADLYQASAKELLAAVQRIDQQSPDASETRERMKKEYDELLKLTVDARLNAQKEDAQLLKTRLEKIEAQIAENEKQKAEMVQQLDQQLRSGIVLKVPPSLNIESEISDPPNLDKNDQPKSQIFDFKAGFQR